jgi:endonuclease-3
MVTPDLFARYDTPQELAEAHPDEVFNYIKSISYPNNKARHLVCMAQKLCSDFGGEVPATLEELTTLPGVGRKTANVIQAVVYNKAAMAVDTHVFRVSHRIGLVHKSCTTPYSVEKRLVKYIPEKLIPKAHHWLILHGRYVCKARLPECDKCGLTGICREYANKDKKVFVK